MSDVETDVEHTHSHFRNRQVDNNLSLYELSEEAAAALRKIGDEDPAVMLRWNLAKVNGAVQFLNDAWTKGRAMPAWFGRFPTNAGE